MKRILFLLVLMSWCAVFWMGKRYGQTHRTRAEQLEMMWDNGRDFERGWSAYEQSMGVKFIQTNGWCGWICTRVAGNVPPGYTLEICATNRAPGYSDKITVDPLAEKLESNKR